MITTAPTPSDLSGSTCLVLHAIRWQGYVSTGVPLDWLQRPRSSVSVMQHLLPDPDSDEQLTWKVG